MRDIEQFRRLAIRIVAIGIVSATNFAVQAQTYAIYPPGSGLTPEAGVTIKGDLVYGTATAGGDGAGEVFEAKHLGNIYSFPGGNGSGEPEARVVFGPDSHLYGTASKGGSASAGFVFNLIPQLTICKVADCQPWRASALHIFTGFPADGAQPGYGDLTWDKQGNIYGTTILGGSVDVGIVYELMPPIPPSKTWTENVIWNFTGPDGKYPQNAVIFDGNGNLLGTTMQGGQHGFGTIFKLTPSQNGWVETNIYDFQGGNDGKSPIAGLTLDSAGNLYGATSDGGSGGAGTAFELAPSGDTYTFKLLYSFSGQQGRNCGPWASLTIDAAGSLYGTTYCGSPGSGSIFRLSNTQNGWAYTSLHDFGSVRGDGFLPISNVTFDASGSLWGTASQGGGGENAGIVWKITP